MKIASITSKIFHPIITPSILGLAILSSDFYTNAFLTNYAFRLILFLPLLFTLIFPILFLVSMKVFRVIHSFEMPEKNERIRFLVIYCILQLLGLHLAGKIGLPNLYSIPNLVALGNGILLMIFYLFSFPSLHAAGWSSLFFSLLVIPFLYPMNLFFWLPLAAISWGIAGSSRLVEDRHQPIHIVLGSCIGLCSIIWILLFG